MPWIVDRETESLLPHVGLGDQFVHYDLISESTVSTAYPPPRSLNRGEIKISCFGANKIRRNVLVGVAAGG